jgi:hypothetical protein
LPEATSLQSFGTSVETHGAPVCHWRHFSWQLHVKIWDAWPAGRWVLGRERSETGLSAGRVHRPTSAWQNCPKIPRKPGICMPQISYHYVYCFPFLFAHPLWLRMFPQIIS